MKEPEDMTIAELRAELRAQGVTERLSTLILREMGEAERRITEGFARGARFAVHLPLPFLSMASSSARMRLQHRLSALEPEVRKLLIDGTIHGDPTAP